MGEKKNNPGQLVFGLDIGTRSIVGTVGYRTDETFHVVAQCDKKHDTRAMLDGQIHDINTVGRSIEEVKRNLELAKAIPFAKTNEQLKEYRFPKGEGRKESMWQLLLAMKNSGLKDDGLLSIFYEIVGESYNTVDEFSIFLFYGSYDVPTKGTDSEWIEGSEEVYDFIVCAISPLEGEYEPGKPEFGFLFPAFVDRSSDSSVIDIFNVDPDNVQTDLMEKILGVRV